MKIAVSMAGWQATPLRVAFSPVQQDVSAKVGDQVEVTRASRPAPIQGECIVEEWVRKQAAAGGSRKTCKIAHLPLHAFQWFRFAAYMATLQSLVKSCCILILSKRGPTWPVARNRWVLRAIWAARCRCCRGGPQLHGMG